MQAGYTAGDGRVKTGLAFGFVLMMAWIPVAAWDALLLAAGVMWGTLWWCRVGVWTIWRRSLIAVPFVLTALTLVVSQPGTPLVSITVGQQAIIVTDGGIAAAATVLIKAWLSVQAMLALMATTHVSEVVRAGAALRLPPILLAILDMTYRYLVIMHEEAIRMLRARDSRSASIPGHRYGQTLRWRARMTGQMIATLVIRAYERSERVYAAMLARGYTGHPLRTTHPPLRGREYALLGGGLVVFASILVIAYT